MRDYGIISPLFWAGKTGREIVALGDDAIVVALYLVTCPHASMTGLFHLPVAYIAHDTGRPLEGASKALRRVCGTGFAIYDEDSSTVFVPGMARWQIAERLDPADKRCKGVAREFAQVRNSPLAIEFWKLYAEAFHLPESLKPEVSGKPLRSPLQAPSKPLRSQEQEQEHDHDHEQEGKHSAPVGAAVTSHPKASEPAQTHPEPTPAPSEPSENATPASLFDDREAISPTVPDKPRNRSKATATALAAKCDPETLVAHYHRILPHLPGVRVPLSHGVKSAVVAALGRDPLEVWAERFERAAESDFLSGRKADWKANLLWLLGPKNAAKLDAGQYQNHEAEAPTISDYNAKALRASRNIRLAWEDGVGQDEIPEIDYQPDPQPLRIAPPEPEPVNHEAVAKFRGLSRALLNGQR